MNKKQVSEVAKIAWLTWKSGGFTPFREWRTRQEAWRTSKDAIYATPSTTHHLPDVLG